MQLEKPLSVIAPDLCTAVRAADRIANHVVGSVSVEDQRVNRFLAVGRQEDLHVEIDCELLHETRKLDEKLGVHRILELVDQQHAAADTSEEEPNLERVRLFFVDGFFAYS